MKDREIFSGLITTVPFVLRLDGRSFHHLSRDAGYVKPYDPAFSKSMAKTAQALLEDSGLAPSFAYTFSDEISLYITSPIFDCRVEKLVSVAAGFASSAFTLFSGTQNPLSFDCRVVPIGEGQLAAYLAWRQAEAWRNHINGYTHKLLTDTGLSTTAAQKRLDGMKSPELHELAFSFGVNLAETPAWQRRGTAVYRSVVEKDGYNPMSREMVRVLRRMPVIDEDLPLFKTSEGASWLAARLSSAGADV
ncbi:MAG: tRNA 5'-guanylyltransferase [Methanocalculaceae archaeon]|jgi:tRNA(His) 5'-end guanylyltransferase|nr:tRNA 5'-guanylyltransferase [Methanocalculaceae archaeon]